MGVHRSRERRNLTWDRHVYASICVCASMCDCESFGLQGKLGVWDEVRNVSKEVGEAEEALIWTPEHLNLAVQCSTHCLAHSEVVT